MRLPRRAYALLAMTIPIVFYLKYKYLYFKFTVYFYLCNKTKGGGTSATPITFTLNDNFFY